MWTGIPENVTEEIPFEPPRSSCGQEFRKMLPRKYLLSHRGAHVDRNSGENVTEEISFEPPRSSCGQEFPGKYHRGIPFEVRNTVLQARNNSWTAGTNFKSTEVLGGIFPTEALFFFHRGLTQRLCWTGCYHHLKLGGVQCPTKCRNSTTFVGRKIERRPVHPVQHSR